MKIEAMNDEQKRTCDCALAWLQVEGLTVADLAAYASKDAPPPAVSAAQSQDLRRLQATLPAKLAIS